MSEQNECLNKVPYGIREESIFAIRKRIKEYGVL